MNLKRIASVMTFALLACSAVSTANATSRSNEIPGFHQVDNFLAVGEPPTGRGVRLLADHHFGTIIDLRLPDQKTNDEQRDAVRNKMAYINLPVEYGVPTDQQVSKFVQTVEAALPSRNMDWIPAVYVHGTPNTGATGCMLAIWRVTHDHYTYKRAISEGSHLGFNMRTPEIGQLVKEYADGTKKL